MKIAGIDEAGKGPVIGPMCVAGVAIDEDRVHLIKACGVKDSKKLTPRRRTLLDEKIREIADGVFVFEVSAQQIDELRTIKTMNEIVVICNARVLEHLRPEHAFLDAADVNEARFGKNVQKECKLAVAVTSRHRADDTYPIVAAASIVAKVARDRAIDALQSEIGKIGSGYPSDPVTIRFLKGWYRENGSLPECVRHSWKTAKNVIASAAQRTL